MPSGAMENTIRVGEKIQLTPGDEFKNNDVVIFSLWTRPFGNYRDTTLEYRWENRVSRLIAQSGDVLEIKDAEVYIDNRMISLPPDGKMEYELLLRRPIAVPEGFEDKIYPTRDVRGDTIIYRADLSRTEIETLRGPDLYGVKKYISHYVAENAVTRNAANDYWTVDNYGPLKIPMPGQTITIDKDNFNLYQNLPDVQIGTYIIKEKLYFVMGDNRHQAQDSRYVGFISHSKMKGIVKNK